MADKKEKDQEPEKVVFREIVVENRECKLCGLKRDDVILMRLRATPPIDGVVDPAYEHDYGVPVCGECRMEINVACANTEILIINKILARSAEKRERQRDRAYLHQAWEEVEEEMIYRRELEKMNEGEDQNNG